MGGRGHIPTGGREGKGKGKSVLRVRSYTENLEHTNGLASSDSTAGVRVHLATPTGENRSPWDSES